MPEKKYDFDLYPEEKHWWSFSDHQAVMDVMRALRPARVLEFGPGSSTLALIEGGAEHIDTCEDNPDWEAVYRERLEHVYPSVVTLHTYTWSDPLKIPALTKQRWDLGLIDGPLGTTQRPPVIAWCLTRCQALLVPTEDSHCQGTLRPVLEALATKHKRRIEYMETGPLSGGFALVTKP